MYIVQAETSAVNSFNLITYIFYYFFWENLVFHQELIRILFLMLCPLEFVIRSFWRQHKVPNLGDQGEQFLKLLTFCNHTKSITPQGKQIQHLEFVGLEFCWISQMMNNLFSDHLSPICILVENLQMTTKRLFNNYSPIFTSLGRIIVLV